MKNARLHNKTESSAPGQDASIVALGSFPQRKATVAAEVLTRLLEGQKLTGLDAVADASTTRLSAFIHYLTKEYGWRIESARKAAGCRDGRVSWVSEYWVLPELASCAVAAGAGAWCVEVKAARLAKRAEATLACRIADRANQALQRARDAGMRNAGQSGLFDSKGGAHA